MKNSSISWTHATFNPWQGCTKVSAGCAHCYAETLSNRWGKDLWGLGRERQRTSAAYWKQPLAWNREAEKSGERRRVFCASMADVFDSAAPEEWRKDLFALIAQTPWLDWLLLTKRPDYILGYTREGIESIFRENVWLGVSVENQEAAEKRIPILKMIPVAVRFISAEPLLGPLDLNYPIGLFPKGPQYCCSGLDDYGMKDCACAGQPIDPPLIYGISWIIAGGESGPGCRPMNIDWAEDLKRQADAAKVPFFMKQAGGFPNKRESLNDLPSELQVRDFPNLREEEVV
jgi:protein gp37